MAKPTGMSALPVRSGDSSIATKTVKPEAPQREPAFMLRAALRHCGQLPNRAVILEIPTDATPPSSVGPR